MKKLLFVLFFILISQISFAKIIKINCFVSKVIDGDTIICEYNQLPLRVRFAYIDAFEIDKNKHFEKQKEQVKKSNKEILELGLKAKKFVENKIFHKFICVVLSSKNLQGAYGRYLGIVYDKPCQLINPMFDKSLNKIELEKGLATIYKK